MAIITFVAVTISEQVTRIRPVMDNKRGLRDAWGGLFLGNEGSVFTAFEVLEDL